jgi:hypothetical protein
MDIPADNPKAKMMRAWDDLHWASPRTNEHDPASVRALDDIRDDFTRMADAYCSAEYSSPKRKDARKAYKALLKIPLTSRERDMAQQALAFLRDFIAYEEGLDPEDVQASFEAPKREDWELTREMCS